MEKRPASKRNLLIGILIMFVLWILFAFNARNADTWSYKAMYQDIWHIYEIPKFADLEPGFVLWMRLCAFIGLPYSSFILVTATASLAILWCLVTAFTSKPGLVFLLYGIFPFFLDVVQFRNFLSMLFLLLAIYVILSRPQARPWALALCLGLALSFHKTAILYLLLFVVYLLPLRKIQLLTIGIVPLGSAFVLFGAPIVTHLLHDSRYLYYFEYQISNPGKLVMITYFLVHLGLSHIMHDALSRGAREESWRWDRYLSLQYLITWTFPLILFTIDFYRFYRNFVVLQHIFFVLTLSQGRFKKQSHRWIFLIAYFLFVVGSAYLFIYFSNMDGVVKPILFENTFFRWIGGLR